MQRIFIYFGFLMVSLLLGTRPSWAAAWFSANIPLCVVLVGCTLMDRDHAIFGAALIGLMVDLISSCPTGTHTLVFALASAYTWESLQIVLHEKWFAQLLMGTIITFTCSILVETILVLIGRPPLAIGSIYAGAGKEATANGLILPLLYHTVKRLWGYEDRVVYRIRMEMD